MRKASGIKLLTVTVAVFSMVMCAAASSPAKVYEEAQDMMINGNYTQAAEQFEKYAFYEDASVLGMYCRAAALAEQGEHLAAAEAFDQISDYGDSELRSRYCFAYALAFEYGDNSAVIRDGADAFEEISSYKDSYSLSIKAEERANSIDYAAADKCFSEKNYLKANEIFLSLGDYKDSSARAAVSYSLYEDELAGAKKSKAYSNAERLENGGDLFAAYEAFAELGSFKDSVQRAEKCREKIYALAEQYENNGRYTEAYDTFSKLGSYKDSAQRASETYLKEAYTNGCSFESAGDYFSAYQSFVKAGDYKDSLLRAEECLEKYRAEEYERADNFEKNEDFSSAYDIFTELGSYNDSAARAENIFEKAYYQKGSAAIENGDYAEAAEFFEAIPEYEDADTKRYLSGTVNYADLMEQINEYTAIYSFNNEWGIVNFRNNLMIHPAWENIYSPIDTDILIVEKNNRFGLADLSGEYVFPCTWDQYERTADEVFAVQENGKWGMINVHGDVLVEPKWNSWEYISDMICFAENISDNLELKGIASKDGRVIFNAKWKDISHLGGQFAQTEFNGKFGIINYDGTILQGCKWNRIAPRFSDGVFVAEKLSKDKTRSYDLVNMNGGIISPYPFAGFGAGTDSLAAEFIDGQMLAKTFDNRFGYINREGKVIEPVYEDAAEFSYERAAVKKDGFWGYIDASGSLVIENKYTYASDFFENGFAAAKMQDGRYFMLSSSGENNYFEDTRYNVARGLENEGKYEEAIALYEDLDVFDDSERRIVECRIKYAEELYAEGKYDEAKAVYLNLHGFEDRITDCDYQINLGTYNQALALEKEEKYEEAEELFLMIPNFQNADYHLRKLHAISAYELFEKEKYDEAKSAFEQLEGYEDMVCECIYQTGLRQMKDEDYNTAYETLLPIKEYKDTKEYLFSEPMLSAKFGHLSVGETMTFGNYPQSGEDPEPIEWIVLDVQDEKVLLVSKYALDARPFGNADKTVTWETSPLRFWLNGEFRKTAFSEDEQMWIDLVEVSTPTFTSEIKTKDKLFILSRDEIMKYWPDAADRKAEPTQYAIEGGLNRLSIAYGYCSWWVRGKVPVDHSLGRIYYNGELYNEPSYDSAFGVRPAFWLNIAPDTESVATAPDYEAVFGNLSAGDEVLFGSYEQDNNAATDDEPIIWTVLDIKDGKALLLSKYNLDCQPYNDSSELVSWDKSTLRYWMNCDFRKKAFNTEEDNWILMTETEDDCADKVFALSVSDIQRYFMQVSKRQAHSTEYCRYNSSYFTKVFPSQYWARNNNENYVCAISHSGTVVNKDDYFYHYLAVRPAIWVSMTKPEEKVSDGETRAYDFSDIKPGDNLCLGRYEQDGNAANDEEPIEWEVLDVAGGKALLLSHCCLEAMPYNEAASAVDWSSSTLRHWLNDDFIKTSFKPDEESRIRFTDIGNRTEDKVFILSYDELTEYLPKSEQRMSAASCYAGKTMLSTQNGNCSWWLRSTDINRLAPYVGARTYDKGYVNVSYKSYGVRPAIWINTNS